MNEDEQSKQPSTQPELITESLMRQIAGLDVESRARLAAWASQFTGARGQSPVARERYDGAKTAMSTTEPPGLRLHNIEAAFAMPSLDDRDVLVFDALVAAAKVILRNVPESGDRSSALRDLRVARWKAHSAIANHGRF